MRKWLNGRAKSSELISETGRGFIEIISRYTHTFLFVDFLNRNQALIKQGEPVINDIGLAALALLVAESNPCQKDIMIRLIENMLTGVN